MLYVSIRIFPTVHTTYTYIHTSFITNKECAYKPHLNYLRLSNWISCLWHHQHTADDDPWIETRIDWNTNYIHWIVGTGTCCRLTIYKRERERECVCVYVYACVVCVCMRVLVCDSVVCALTRTYAYVCV